MKWVMFLMRTAGVAAAAVMAAGISAAAPASSPVFFLPSHNQPGSPAQFVVRGSGLTAFFAPRTVAFRTREGAVQMEFSGASPAGRIEPLEQLPGVANVLEGSEENWQTGLPLYSGVAYRELYPGIDLIYGSTGNRLKSQFVVAPGADPSRILIRYSGAGQLQLDPDGSLLVPVGRRQVREEAPVAWQEHNGSRVPVDIQFALFGDAVGFAAGSYDRTAALVIDPTVSYSTLLGGSGVNAGMALAVDSTGAAYIAGFTSSYNFPTANPEQNFNSGSNDVFVAKLSPAGNALVYATYIGGSGDDRAYGIAVDSTGAAYVAGSSMSANFPVRSALQSRLAGGRNAVVLKLNPAGNSLVFSTYLGGSGLDVANGIALDSSGNIYVAGDTTSTNFPATSGAFQRSNRGSQNAFVAKLNSSGSSLVYSTYVGGSLTDHAAGIAVDAAGTAFIAGSTWSTNFPVANAYQGALAGGQDAFAARIAASGASLVFSTYLGGSGGNVGQPETANGITVDSQGSAYVTGTTSSSNFPLLNPYQSTLRGWSDAFISKFSSAGALVYSTYLGGDGLDTANGIAVDTSGDAYIAGYTSVMNLVAASPTASASPGAYNAFVAELNSAGNGLPAFAYIVDTGSDTASAIALDHSGNVYFAGWTLSPNFPVVSGVQSVNGGYSAFVTKINFVAASPLAVSVTPASGSGASQTFSFVYSDGAGVSALSSLLALINGSLSGPGSCDVTVDPVHDNLWLLNDGASAWLGPITLGTAGTVQNSQCTVNGSGSSVATTATTVTVNMAVTFQSAFAGAKIVYGNAVDTSAHSAGWTQLGTWTVATIVSQLPQVVSVSPSSGSGTSQTFSFVYSDSAGVSAFNSLLALINGSLSGPGSCDVTVDPVHSYLWLLNDGASAWLGPITLGTTGTVQNSQCTVNGSGSSMVTTATTVTVNMAVTFQSAFAGAKIVYGNAVDNSGHSAGWTQLGTWTIGGSSKPLQTVSVSPATGTGSSQTFTFVYSDSAGISDINSLLALINTGLNGVSACDVTVDPVHKNLWLLNDGATAWLGPIVLGSAGNVQNDQCTVIGGSSSMTTSGSTVTLNVALSFQASFDGAKVVYGNVVNQAGSTSGWTLLGTWTVH